MDYNYIKNFDYFMNYKISNIESFTNNNILNNAIALLTIRPKKIWLDFLNKFTNNYDIYIFIDDNNFDLTSFINEYENLHFIQIDDDESIKYGYSNSSYIIKSGPIAWDKALYYFTIKSKINYNYVWFIEDDVFIYSLDIIRKIDNDNENIDLICKSCDMNDGTNPWYHWEQARDTLSEPWYNSLVCICRLSNKLLKKINDYVNKYGKLVFIEVLFTTIAKNNNLNTSTPKELSKIEFAKDWNINNLEMIYIYHPFKNIDNHEYIRNKYII